MKRHVLKSTAIPDQNQPATPVHGSQSDRRGTKERKRRELFFDDEKKKALIWIVTVIYLKLI